MRWFLLILGLAACTPRPASAVTLAEVVALSKGGVSEPVILALIERDQTLFSMSPDQLVKLQRQGLSDTILLALIKSGRPSEASLPKKEPRHQRRLVDALTSNHGRRTTPFSVSENVRMYRRLRKRG